MPEERYRQWSHAARSVVSKAIEIFPSTSAVKLSSSNAMRSLMTSNKQFQRCERGDKLIGNLMNGL